MDKLKPCPFCGGEAVVSGHHNRFTEWYLCSCQKCHISQTGSEYGFKFEAIEAWNSRVNDAPVRHGRWIDAYPDIEPNPMFMYGICSECGFEQGISKYLNYCPNCGAKMDGGNEGE